MQNNCVVKKFKRYFHIVMRPNSAKLYKDAASLVENIFRNTQTLSNSTLLYIIEQFLQKLVATMRKKEFL